MKRLRLVEAGVLGVACAAAGCVSRGSYDLPLSAPFTGSYVLSGSVEGQIIDATLSFGRDHTYRIDSNHGSCNDRRLQDAPRGARVRIGCSNLVFLFDVAADEFQRVAQVSLVTTERVRVGVVCVQYATSSTGVRSCVREEVQYADRPVTRNGSVEVRRT